MNRESFTMNAMNAMNVMTRKNPLIQATPPAPIGALHLAALAVVVWAATGAARAESLDCMIQPNQIVLVGSSVPGVVDEIAVERGDTITRGQVLAQLRANVERAALSVARERASQVGEGVVARSAQELARNELERANEMYAQKFVSKTYLEKQQAEAKGAGGRTEQASERNRLANREVELAQAQLAQRTIRAPVSGVVVERLVAPGELVDQKPLLRIASIDPLRVDVLVPAAAFGQIAPGLAANVVPELFNRSTHVAVVKTVDRVVDAASNTFRVRLELPNPSGALPAGLRCKIELALKLPEPSRAATAQAAGVKAAPATKPGAPAALAPAVAPATSPAVAPAAAPITTSAARPANAPPTTVASTAKATPPAAAATVQR